MAAAEAAIKSPLLEASIEGARGVLFNITGGKDLSLYDVTEASNVITESVDPDANIIFGAVIDEALEDEIRVTVIATGFDDGPVAPRTAETAPARTVAAPATAQSEKPQGLFTAATEKQAAAPAAPAAATSDGEEDPFDSIFKIFNSK